jgi:hypothetical protein
VQELEGQLADLWARRSDVATRLTMAHGRKSALAATSTAALLDTTDAKAQSAARRDHVAAAAEVDALELALATADERIEGLAARVGAAKQRVAAALALGELDELLQLAARVDAAWAPVRRQLEAFALVEQDTAAAFDGLLPGHSHGRGRTLLTHLLLWPISDLLELPRAGDRERVALVEHFTTLYRTSRATLERALADEKGASL